MRPTLYLLFFAVVLQARAPAPLAGTWKLNLAKSSYEAAPPPYKRSTCRIEIDGDNARVIYDMVGTQGGTTHLEWVGRFDGRDYPIQGVDEVLTNAYTRVDERTYDVIVKADGARAATAHIVVAPDGKTLTTVTTSKGAGGKTVRTTTVYDKSEQ